MQFGFHNPSETAQTIGVSAECVRTIFKSGGKRRRIDIERGLFDLSVAPGDRLFQGRCTGGAILFAGFSLPPDGRVSFFGASYQRDGAQLALGNHTLLAESAEAALLCARGRVKAIKQV